MSPYRDKVKAAAYQKAYHVEWYARNRAERIKQIHAWRKANPDKVIAQRRRNYAKRGAEAYQRRKLRRINKAHDLRLGITVCSWSLLDDRP